MGLEHFGSLGGETCVFTQRDVEQNLNRRTTLHVAQELECELRCDLRNFDPASSHLLEEVSLDATSSRRARQGVVNEEVQRLFAVCMARRHDNAGHLCRQRALVNRLGAEPLPFAGFDFFEIGVIEAHQIVTFRLDYRFVALHPGICMRRYTTSIPRARLTPVAGCRVERL